MAAWSQVRLHFTGGAAALMAFDLAQVPRTEIIVQLCGDAHLEDFGLFASHERRILFGPSDFDETLAGPFDSDRRPISVQTQDRILPGRRAIWAGNHHSPEYGVSRSKGLAGREQVIS